MSKKKRRLRENAEWRRIISASRKLSAPLGFSGTLFFITDFLESVNLGSEDRLVLTIKPDWTQWKSHQAQVLRGDGTVEEVILRDVSNTLYRVPGPDVQRASSRIEASNNSIHGAFLTR